MRLRATLIAALGPLALVAAGQTAPPAARDPEVALAPFMVEKDNTGALRAVADACLERLATGLAAKGISVVRHPSLDEKTLSRGRPAPWAVLGRFSSDKGQIRAELRLMEISSGDEMRAYLNANADPQAIVGLGGAAAERIALFVKEKRASTPGR